MGAGNSLNVNDAGYVVFDGNGTFEGRTFQAGTGISLLNASGIDGDTTINASGTNIKINGDTGTATGPIITQTGNTTAGSTVTFNNSGSSSLFKVTDSSLNTIIGNLAGNASITGTSNVGLGRSSLAALTIGINNVAIGAFSGASITSGNSNSSLGRNSLDLLTSGSSNVAVGQSGFPSLLTGSFNIGLGVNAGSTYTSSESNNILISSAGVIGDNHAMRLGTTGSNPGQVNQAFIAGVNGVTVSNPQIMVMNSSTEQVGTVSFESSMITSFTVDGSWTINARTKIVRFIAWGGGGGGGSGRCGASSSAGGGAGGACGSFVDISYDASVVTGSPYTVTIGTGGAGGALVNATTTDGNPGIAGLATTVGAIVNSGGGLAGAGGSGAVSGAISSFSSDGLYISTATIVTGGNGGGGNTTNGIVAPSVIYGRSTGGGGGVGYTSATARTGTAGGNITDGSANILVAGGIAGTNSGGNGGNGNSPSNQPLTVGGTGGGSGGHNGTTTAGSGGNGATPGGGGGGGAGNLSLNASGAGGNGANGKLIVIEYF